MFSIAKTERVTEREGTTAFAALCGGEDVLRDAGRPLLRGGDEQPDNATVAIRAGRRLACGQRQTKVSYCTVNIVCFFVLIPS
jgi:hypothetical protein